MGPTHAGPLSDSHTVTVHVTETNLKAAENWEWWCITGRQSRDPSWTLMSFLVMNLLQVMLQVCVVSLFWPRHTGTVCQSFLDVHDFSLLKTTNQVSYKKPLSLSSSGVSSSLSSTNQFWIASLYLYASFLGLTSYANFDQTWDGTEKPRCWYHWSQDIQKNKCAYAHFCNLSPTCEFIILVIPVQHSIALYSSF